MMHWNKIKVEGMVTANFQVLLLVSPERTDESMKISVSLADSRPLCVTTKPICSLTPAHITYVLQKLPLTVVSFHPYPDDQLLPLAQAKYSQPVKETRISTHTVKICI
jgi:hypothetical protein